MKPLRSISSKLFIVTAALLLIFLTVMTVVQMLFFESYYVHKKTTDLTHRLNTLRALSLEQPSGYMDEEQTATLIFEHMLLDDRHDDVTFAIGHPGKGYIIKSIESSKLSIQVINSDEPYEGSLGIPSSPDLLAVLQSWQQQPKLVDQVESLGETVTFTDEYSADYRVLAAVTELPHTEYVMLAATSLQPVDEAAGVIRDFYLFFLLLAIGFIFFLTFLFSRMITRPLVQLNRVAKQMGSLDFTAASDIRTQDEIGNLGRTLNFLSRNLHRTLQELHTANAQLKEDLAKEKQLERMRKEFVASVSHELKTPISLIGGYAEGLRDGIVDGKRRDEYVNVIIEESEKLASLVREVIDLSRLESGQLELHLEPFRIDELADSIVNKMSMEISKNRLRCETAFAPNLPEVQGDKFRIGQVLTNLLSNAVKHTPSNGLIRISIVQQEAVRDAEATQARTVYVSVYNEGEPIPEEELPHIWESFYTIDKSRNRERGGSGLGLAIVRNILTVHGSRFGAVNAQGGVEFHFTLPPSARPSAASTPRPDGSMHIV